MLKNTDTLKPFALTSAHRILMGIASVPFVIHSVMDKEAIKTMEFQISFPPLAMDI